MLFEFLGSIFVSWWTIVVSDVCGKWNEKSNGAKMQGSQEDAAADVNFFGQLQQQILIPTSVSAGSCSSRFWFLRTQSAAYQSTLNKQGFNSTVQYHTAQNEVLFSTSTRNPWNGPAAVAMTYVTQFLGARTLNSTWHAVSSGRDSQLKRPATRMLPSDRTNWSR